LTVPVVVIAELAAALLATGTTLWAKTGQALTANRIAAPDKVERKRLVVVDIASRKIEFGTPE
jgi:hypothetical protein